MMLKRKEFTELKQGSMTVTEYLNRFTQLSRYAPEDVSTDARKQYLFLNGLHNEIQLQLLNCDYANFQKLVEKAIMVENKRLRLRRKESGRCHFPDSSLMDSPVHVWHSPRCRTTGHLSLSGHQGKLHALSSRCRGLTSKCQGPMLRCSAPTFKRLNPLLHKHLARQLQLPSRCRTVTTLQTVN